MKLAPRLHAGLRRAAGALAAAQDAWERTDADPFNFGSVPRLAGRRPRLRQVSPRLKVVEESPQVRATPVDPVVGVQFIVDRHRRRSAGSGEDDASLVARQPWYHTIDLPDGSVTNGAFDHRGLLPYYGIPDDLTGQTVMDVATADGFWAFELERRGGRVTALDVETTDQIDLPPEVRTHARANGISDSLADGFALAHRLRGSSVMRLNGSIYDLDPGEVGTFDLVHSGDVLVHLRDPNLALQRIRSITGGMALLSDTIDPTLGDQPGLARYLGGRNTAGWWLPSLGTLVQMVSDAGFRHVDVVKVYNLALGDDANGPWRAVVRAKP